MARFDDKVALVTGGGSGIGEAVAKRLASEGASVVVSDISEDSAKRVVDEIAADGGTASYVVGDVSTPEGNEASVRFAVDTYGKLNLALNNAGIGGAQANLADVELDDWKRVIDLNLNGVFYGMKYEIPEMLKDPGNSAIVNMASIHGAVAALGSDAYTTSKHAVVGITKNAAAEYGPDNLRINCVAPGYILTPLLEAHLDEETQAFIASKHPMGRLGTPQEVAAIVCFLLSSDASFCTGGYYLVDGGYTSV